MKVFRIEHSETKLGPFSHNGNGNGASQFLRSGIGMMEDIDNHPEVITLLSEYGDRIRFGWSDIETLEVCITRQIRKNGRKKKINFKRALFELGFVISEYEVTPLYINESDNQVVFAI